MSHDNVINVDFGRQDSNGQVRDALALVAKERGYSPDRAAEIASIVCAAGEEMTRATVSVNLTVRTPASGDEVEAAIKEAVRLAVRQTSQHCQRQFVSAALDLCYPVRR